MMRFAPPIAFTASVVCVVAALLFADYAEYEFPPRNSQADSLLARWKLATGSSATTPTEASGGPSSSLTLSARRLVSHPPKLN